MRDWIEFWNDLWEKWDLRGFIILSLSLQAFLILSSPLRKRTCNAFVSFPIWLAYLLADAAANFAVGLIAKSQSKDSPVSFPNTNLLAFWAPFLLVHLGGPDTITAFALEDNELWLRHLLLLVFQSGSSAYVFFLTLSENRLWIPTVLMFLPGLIKYTERTRSLYLASTRRFRESLLTEPDPGPNYAKFMDEYFSKWESKLPTRIEMIPEPNRIIKTVNEAKDKRLDDLEIVQNAYRHFQTFKGIIADLIFSFRERNQSREFFLKRNAREAFKIVEVELNFFYEILYTKVVVIQGKIGYFLRFISFCSVVVSLILFLREDKKGISRVDVRITYALFWGAIGLDFIAFFMLILSDWTAVALTKSEEPSLGTRLLQKLLCVKRRRWVQDQKDMPFRLRLLPSVILRRWSGTISQYNLLYYCLHPRPINKEKLIGFFGLTNVLDGLKYVKKERFNDWMRDFIFDELKWKSEMADDLETSREICSSKGEWILAFEGCDGFLPSIQQSDYDERLLLWHVATDLCYNTDEDSQENPYREFAKIMSDYMLYLLIMEPILMSAVAGIGQIRFRDTCAEAKKFFKERKVIKKIPEQIKLSQSCYNFLNVLFCCFKKWNGGKEKRWGEKKLDKEHTLACENILRVHTVVKPVTVKGDRSKSVVFDACILAKELKKMKDKGKDKWKIMSKVWVELLSYAACHCRANTHAAHLSKGGQLISLVWLLMAHLGLGGQFQINEGHARAKLIVEK